MLLIEDLHWIDSASQELLERIVRSGTERLLLLHTRRPEYESPWRDGTIAAKLHLAPLEADDVRRLIQTRLSVEAVPEALARQIVDKAEGNPLFAEEIASFLTERRILRVVAGKVEADAAALISTLPESLQSVLRARVDRLAAMDRTLLTAAAVIGRRFDPDLLAAIADSDDIRLAAMQTLDLVRLEGKSNDYAFKHALVRDALYQRLLTSSRTALHRRIATEIERRSGNRITEVVEILAHHHSQTDEEAKAFVYLAMAGTKSLNVYSLGPANGYFSAAVTLVRKASLIARAIGNWLICLRATHPY